MIYVYKREPNQLLFISRLKSKLLNEVESNHDLIMQWEQVRTALLNSGPDVQSSSHIAPANDPKVFDWKRDMYGFIFTSKEDGTHFVVTSWLIEEYGSPLTTHF